MVLYYTVFLTLALLSFMELFCRTNRKLMTIIARVVIITFLILTSIRGAGLGGDYMAYKEGFELMTDTSQFLQRRNFFYEPLYSLIQYFTKMLFCNYQIFLLVIGCIVMFMQYRFAMEYTTKDIVELQPYGMKRTVRCDEKIQRGFYKKLHSCDLEGKYFFTIFLVLWALYNANIVVTRSNISACICLYSVKYITLKDWKRFVCLVLVAVGFHYSAMIFMPAYIIYHFHSSLGKKIGIFIIGSTFLSVGIVPIAGLYARMVGGRLEEKIFSYLESTDFMGGTGLSTSANILILKALANIGILIFTGMFLWKFNKTNRKYEGYFNLYLTGCILYIATLSIGYAFARLSIYYNIFQVPMLLYLISDKKDSIQNKYIYWLLMFFYLLFRYSVNIAGKQFVTFWQA